MSVAFEDKMKARDKDSLLMNGLARVLMGCVFRDDINSLPNRLAKGGSTDRLCGFNWVVKKIVLLLAVFRQEQRSSSRCWSGYFQRGKGI